MTVNLWKGRSKKVADFETIIDQLDCLLKAAKALDIDVDKIWSDMARALVREELTKEERKKMRKEKK